MSAKIKGKAVRQVVSARMEPSAKKKLIKKYGSIQKAVDWLIGHVASGDKVAVKEVK